MTPEEVNLILAEKLMKWKKGWKKGKDFTVDRLGNIKTLFRDRWPDNEFDPYHRIEQALGDGGEGTVDYEMAQQGWKLSLHRKKNGFKAIYWHPEKWDDGIGKSDTPSSAACLAAVAALQAEKEKRDEKVRDSGGEDVHEWQGVAAKSA